MHVEQFNAVFIIDTPEREPYEGVPLPVAVRVWIEHSGKISVEATVNGAGVPAKCPPDKTTPKKRTRKDAKPSPVSMNFDRPDSLGVSQDGCFVWTKNNLVWTCPFSPTECELVKAVAKNGGKLDGDVAYKVLWPKLDIDEGKRMRDLQGSINKKLERRGAPVRMSFAGWCVEFVGD